MGCNRWSLAYLKQLVKKIGSEALDIEGAAELKEPAFSPEGLTVSFTRTADITAERSEGRATHREASG